MSKPPVAEQVQVNFRMPVDLRDRIKSKAESNGRSMNAEIIDALESSFPRPQTAGDVVAELAINLAFYPPKLRAEAIELLAAVAKDGRLEERAEIERLAMRDTQWQELSPRDDD